MAERKAMKVTLAHVEWEMTSGVRRSASGYLTERVYGPATSEEMLRGKQDTVSACVELARHVARSGNDPIYFDTFVVPKSSVHRMVKQEVEI